MSAPNHPEPTHPIVLPGDHGKADHKADKDAKPEKETKPVKAEKTKTAPKDMTNPHDRAKFDAVAGKDPIEPLPDSPATFNAPAAPVTQEEHNEVAKEAKKDEKKDEKR